MSRMARIRWQAIAVLALLLALLYVLLLHPFFVAPLWAVESEIAVLQARQARIRAQLEQAPLLEERMRALEQALQQRPGLLPEADPGLAAAGLVRRLEAAVQAASPGGRGCALSERNPLPVAAGERFDQVAVQARLRCGVDELATVLEGLEGGAPRLFVDELDIQAQRYQSSPGESGLGLDVSFRLSGYVPAAVNQAPMGGGGK